MCGCGRTSRPLPASKRVGPNSSQKMKGPTMRFSTAGSARRTMKLSPRSRGLGAMVAITGPPSGMTSGCFSSPGRTLMGDNLGRARRVVIPGTRDPGQRGGGLFHYRRAPVPQHGQLTDVRPPLRLALKARSRSSPWRCAPGDVRSLTTCHTRREDQLRGFGLRERDVLVAQLEQRCGFTEAGTKCRDPGVQCGMIEKVVATESFGSERREAVPPPIEGRHYDTDLLLAEPLLHRVRQAEGCRGRPPVLDAVVHHNPRLMSVSRKDESQPAVTQHREEPPT